MRFVSESLPRLIINGADGSDLLPQTLVFITIRSAGRSPILAVFRTLLAQRRIWLDFDARRTATCGLYESVFETRTRGAIGRYSI